MSIFTEKSGYFCTFCRLQDHEVPLEKTMYGLSCTNVDCFSRRADGNLMPAVPCPKCGENSFYVEEEGTMESAVYFCIACGKKEPME